MKKKYIVSSHANYFIILLTLSQSKSIKESNLYIYMDKSKRNRTQSH